MQTNTKLIPVSSSRLYEPFRSFLLAQKRRFLDRRLRLHAYGLRLGLQHRFRGRRVLSKNPLSGWDRGDLVD